MYQLFLFLFLSTILCADEPIINPAKRTQRPINQVRNIFHQISEVNEERATLGLDPVIDLSLGQTQVTMQTKVLDPFIDYLGNLKNLSLDDLSLEMGYSHPAGTIETRIWISRFFSEMFKEVTDGFDADEVMVANGGSEALSNALKVLIEEGDEVAVFAPYFAEYEIQIKSCGGILAPIPLMLPASRASVLDDYLSSHPKIKVFIWNDLNNLLGTKVSKYELEGLASVLRKYPNLVVIHDEIYKDTIHEAQSFSLMNVAPDLKPRSFIIRSLAKDILGSPGIRVGMISAPTHMRTSDGQNVNFIELMSSEQLLDIASVNVLVQKMLCIALEQKLSGAMESWEDLLKKEYVDNTQFVLKALAEMGLSPLQDPKGSLFIMVDASPLRGKKILKKIGLIDNLDTKLNGLIQTDLDVTGLFLHAAGVALIPGSCFGLTQCCFRISCDRPKEQLVEATERMKEVVKIISQSRRVRARSNN